MAQLNSWVSLSCSSPEKIGLLTFVIYGSTSSLLHQTLTCDHHLDEMYQQSALLLACMMAWIWKITYRGLVAYVEGLTLCPLLTAETLRLLDEPATRASLIALESAAPDHFTSPLALWRSCFLSLARWKEANQVGWVTFIALIWVWKFNRHLLRLRLRVKYCLLYLLVMMWCMFLFAIFFLAFANSTQITCAISSNWDRNRMPYLVFNPFYCFIPWYSGWQSVQSALRETPTKPRKMQDYLHDGPCLLGCAHAGEADWNSFVTSNWSRITSCRPVTSESVR